MKRKNNPHSFQVLQQDHPQLIQERYNQHNENNNHTQDEERKNNENQNLEQNLNQEGEGGPQIIQEKPKKERKKIFTLKPEIIADQKKGLKMLYNSIDKYKILKNTGEVEDEVFFSEN